MKIRAVRLKSLGITLAFIVSIVALQFHNVSFTYAAAKTWDGTAGTGLFSTAGNWVGNAIPVNGDSVTFPAITGGATPTLTNDLAGVSFSGVTFAGNGPSNTTAYTINTLTLSTGTSINVTGTNTTATVTSLTGSGDLTVAGLGDLTVGTLTTVGNLTASSAFAATTVTVGGNANVNANITGGATLNVTGNLIVNDSSLSVAAATVGGALTMTTAFTVTGTLTVDSDVAVSQPITVGTLTTTGSLTTSNTFTATNINVGVNANITNDISGGVTLHVTGSLTVNDPTFSAAAVTVGADLTMTTAFTVTGTLTVANDLTVSQAINVGTLAETGNLATSHTFTATNINVGGNANITNDISGGVTLDVTGNLTVNDGTFSAAAATVHGTLTMTSAFTVTGTLTVDSDVAVSQDITVGTLTTTGDLTNSSDYTATTVNVGGNLTSSNDYTAPTVNVTGNAVLTDYQNNSHKYIIGGTLTIGSISEPYGVAHLADGTNVTGAVTVTNGTELEQDSGANISLGSLLVQNGGEASLYGTVSYPVTFGSGNSQVLPVVAYNSAITTLDSNNKPIYNTVQFTGAVSLLNDLQLQIYGNATSGSINFSGPVTYNGFSMLKTPYTSGTLIVGGVEVHNPAVTNTYTGNLPSDGLAVGDNETAIITGTRGVVEANRGSLIKGTGTILDLDLGYGATVSPGNSPGTLTVLNTLQMVQSSVYDAELQSTSAYDQLAVGAQYTDSSDAVTLTNGPTLNVVLLPGFSIANGDKFTIIDNQSSTPVAGTFNGLPEGATFSVGDGVFSISYVGGDGNDVVLTVISAPSQPIKAPNTGIQFLTTHPALLLGLGGVTAGFFLVMAARRRFNQ